MKFTLSGDGMYLAVVDIKAYQSFVGSDWAKNPRLLEPHFLEQMQNYSGLFWETGLETDLLVDVCTEKTDDYGFREIIGSVKVTSGELVFLEYDALTMMAQFADKKIEKYIKENFLCLDNGNYQVRIIQLFDPQSHFPDGHGTDFIIEIVKNDTLLAPWQTVPWSTLK